jgi:hypothetical protein
MEEVTVISVFLAPSPPAPALVVIKITPFLPKDPYSVEAARPFNTFTLSILFGSKSKNLLEPLLPLMKS